VKRVVENKIILVVRRTHLDGLLSRFSTRSQAKFYVEHSGADFSDYLSEHQQYEEAIKKAEEYLSAWGRVHVLDRKFLPNFIFGQQDTVVVLGQDGLVANTVKYLNGQLVIGVNPDPQRWDGILLPFTVYDLSKLIPEVLARKRPVQEVTMAQVTLNSGQYLYGVNDLFIGPKTHTSARYEIHLDQHHEQHISSGIIVSTGLGSTGWFKSLVAGATGVTQALLGKKSKPYNSSFPWNADYLLFIVREPFPSKTSSTNLLFGEINVHKPMRLVSRMAENGVIFSDGIENDFLEFNSGTSAQVGLADKRGYLII